MVRSSFLPFCHGEVDPRTGDSDSDSGSEHGSESSALSLTRLTARQRAKEIGDPGEELYALPTRASRVCRLFCLCREQPAHRLKIEEQVRRPQRDRDRPQARRGHAQAAEPGQQASRGRGASAPSPRVVCVPKGRTYRNKRRSTACSRSRPARGLAAATVGPRARSRAPQRLRSTTMAPRPPCPSSPFPCCRRHRRSVTVTSPRSVRASLASSSAYPWARRTASRRALRRAIRDRGRRSRPGT